MNDLKGKHMQHEGHVAAEAVTAKAEKKSPGWSIDAEVALREYAKTSRKPFLIESARMWAHEQGLPEPHDLRAWGSVVKRLSAKGELVFAGYASAQSSHHSPKCLWVLM